MIATRLLLTFITIRHLNPVCWSRETSRTCRAGGPAKYRLQISPFHSPISHSTSGKGYISSRGFSSDHLRTVKVTESTRPSDHSTVDWNPTHPPFSIPFSHTLSLSFSSLFQLSTGTRSSIHLVLHQIFIRFSGLSPSYRKTDQNCSVSYSERSGVRIKLIIIGVLGTPDVRNDSFLRSKMWLNPNKGLSVPCGTDGGGWGGSLIDSDGASVSDTVCGQWITLWSPCVTSGVNCIASRYLFWSCTVNGF